MRVSGRLQGSEHDLRVILKGAVCAHAVRATSELSMFPLSSPRMTPQAEKLIKAVSRTLQLGHDRIADTVSRGFCHELWPMTPL